MSNSASEGDSDAGGDVEFASIAVFQHDYELASLKDPLIIPLDGEFFELDSVSDLWQDSMMRRPHQTILRGSFCLEKHHGDEHRHVLHFHDDAQHVKVVVDHKEITFEQMADGFLLEGGELVQIYCLHWLENGKEVDEVVGPLSFQYSAAPTANQPPTPGAPPSVPNLDQLPSEVLQMIFAYLPVNEVLHNIPAVCSKLHNAIRGKVYFHHWEISSNWLTAQEAIFCQNWTAHPVTDLVLSSVLINSLEDWHNLCRFLVYYMRPSRDTITSLKFHLKPLLSGQEEDQRLRKIKGAVYPDLIRRFADFPELKRLKISGFPFWHLNAPTFASFRNLERLWVHFHGTLFLDMDALIKPLIPTLKSITFAFTGKDEPLQTKGLQAYLTWIVGEAVHIRSVRKPRCGVEELFSAYAQPSQETTKRVLVFTGQASEIDRCQMLLTPLKKLNALSVTIDGHLGKEEAKTLINTIPSSVEMLKLMVEDFDDDLCEVVAERCPDLKIFACNGCEIAENGIASLVKLCEGLKQVFLLQEGEDGKLVPRGDILPERLTKNLGRFEEDLRKVFD